MSRSLSFGFMLIAVAGLSVADTSAATPYSASRGPEMTQPTDWSAQRRTRPRRAAAPSRIACTELGCHPIPPGCTPVPGRTWRGNYSGFDVVVCRRR